MTGELTALEMLVEALHSSWDLERYRNPGLADLYWTKLNNRVNQWCQENGYSHEEGWDELRRKLDLRLR